MLVRRLCLIVLPGRRGWRLEVAALSLTLAKAQLQRLILSLVMSSWMEIISE